jgi:hypothetical protein
MLSCNCSSLEVCTCFVIHTAIHTVTFEYVSVEVCTAVVYFMFILWYSKEVDAFVCIKKRAVLLIYAMLYAYMRMHWRVQIRWDPGTR